MKEQKNRAVYQGIGVTALLLIVFIILKLCGVINWSWLWVLAPLWIPIALTIAILIIGGLIIAIKYSIDKVHRKNKKYFR